MSTFSFLNPLGWNFKKSTEQEEKQQTIASPFVQQTTDDASFVVGSSLYGRNLHGFTSDISFDSENELIQRYREAALYPEVDVAISDIVNETIDNDAKDTPVSMNLDNLEQTEAIKKKFQDEFEAIKKLLNFNIDCQEIFRKFYVDGRLNYFVVIDPKSTKEGIKELRYISAFDIKKVREEEMQIGPGGYPIVKSFSEFFLYSPKTSPNTKTASGAKKSNSVQTALKLTKDSVCYITSGIYDDSKNLTYSYLHKALKPINNLRMIEDAVIIYTLTRAPERRIFYIDVGNLNKAKAEEYLKNISTKYQNKTVYDTVTGEVKDAKHTQTMTEDFYMARANGGRGTEVTTLQGGQNLSQFVENLQYFQKKVYSALNVPLSRLQQDGNPAPFMLGRSSEMSRDEVRFSKFVSKLRKRFSELFYQLLEKQLLLKNIISPSEWEEMKEHIHFEFGKDNFFTELKEAEILKERFGTLQTVENYIGTYLSKEYVFKEILKMDEDQIKEMKNQVDKEREEQAKIDAMYNPNPEDEQPSGNPNFGGQQNEEYLAEESKLHLARYNGHLMSAKKVDGKWWVGGDVVQKGVNVLIAAKSFPDGRLAWHKLVGRQLRFDDYLTDEEVEKHNSLK